MSVWDVCAAPGGKTISLAQRVGPDGYVWATEIHERKTEELRARMTRYSWVEVSGHDALRGSSKERLFDAILLDAPCSALGVIRRHPEIRWRRTPSDIKRSATKQLKLLEAVALSVRVGGVIVYSVCTDAPKETIEVINDFLMAYPEFEMIHPPSLHPPSPETTWNPLCDQGALSINPMDHGTDGFFAARLRRTR